MEGFNSSSPSSSTAGLSLGPAIDRCNPIIRDATRAAIGLLPDPKNSSPHHHKDMEEFPEPKNNDPEVVSGDERTIRRINETACREKTSNLGWRKRLSCIRSGGFSSPPGSMRYLLDEKVLARTTSDSSVPEELFSDEKAAESSCDDHHQVVVLRVSLHCKGCEKQVRKHISKMKEVTSFDIDFTTKKVVVNVRRSLTPEEVVSRISMVKNAEIWQ